MLKRRPWPVILQVVPELSTGGAERTTIDVAEAVVRAGGRAIVCSKGGRLNDELAHVGGELMPLPVATKNPLRLLQNAYRLKRIMEECNVTLVHARSRAPAWSALWAARQTGRPFVTTYHGIYNQNSRIKAFYNSVMARGDTVICNSDYTASIVAARHPQAHGRLCVIYRGVDLSRFDRQAVSEARVAAVREEWGVSAAQRVVLLPARLARWKGQQVALAAIALLKKRLEHDPEKWKPVFGERSCSNKNRERTCDSIASHHAQDPASSIVFVFAGDHQKREGYRQELEAQISSQGLASLVRLAGHCTDMPAAFKAADFAVITSIEAEAFGRVSIEAQAMGCPVIASDIGALPETLRRDDVLSEQIEGAVPLHSQPWLFEPGNAHALADRLQAALTTPSAILEVIEQEAMVRIQAKFSKEFLQIQTLKVYDRLIDTQMASIFATNSTADV